MNTTTTDGVASERGVADVGKCSRCLQTRPLSHLLAVTDLEVGRVSLVCRADSGRANLPVGGHRPPG